MNIIAIKTFLAVVRVGNLNRASIELNITQSAVTARLDALDQALGARLLNRSRKGATLTKAGYAFLEQAEVITRMWETAKARTALPLGIKSLFSLVCDPSLWSGLGEIWMDEQRTNNTDIAFEIWTARSQEAQGWLVSGVTDAALLTEPLSGSGVSNRVFSKEKLIQVGTVARNKVDWDPNYVFVDYGPKFRAEHAQTWTGEERAKLNFSNPEWAKQHIRRSGGSTYLPLSMVESDLKHNRLHEIVGSPTFDQTTYLSWRTSSEDDFAWLR